MFVFIGSEVVMEQGGSWVGGHQAGGDVNQVTAGGDMTGVAAGRRNTAVGSQAHRDIETIADVKAALADLTEEVNVAEMSVAHKLQALSVLSWWQEHVDCSEEPPEARAQVVKLQSVGDWIWSRFSKIMADVPYAAAAAWLIEVAKVVAGVH
jgi:hypothetical protein